jgi:Peptidase family S41
MRAFRSVGQVIPLRMSSLVFVSIASFACGAPKNAPATGAKASSRSVVNVHAFARLYGVLRWFHPSDTAAAIDWNRFAIDGVKRVIASPDHDALRASLTAMTTAFAPTVRVVAKEGQFISMPKGPVQTSGFVSWQHLGYGDSRRVSVYASKRTHRPLLAPEPGAPFAALWQSVDGLPIRGAKFRFSGRLRASSKGRSQLWVRVERGQATGFFDNMQDRPVVEDQWRVAEIAGTVDSDATRLVLGILTTGRGPTWYDDLELTVQDPNGAWIPVALLDPGFEANDPYLAWHPGTGRRSTSLEGWHVTLDGVRPAGGSKSLRVEAATREILDDLFSEAPAPGEIIDVELGDGLVARVPISLYSTDGHTTGDAMNVTPALPDSPFQSTDGFDMAVGVADIVVVWNVLNHFWPYWSDLPRDWNAELDVAIRNGLTDRNIDDHVRTLELLSAAAPDGHARTDCVGETPLGWPSFSVEIVEKQVVVVSSASKGIEPGDVVVSVDGRPSAEIVAENERQVSGSPQWRQVRALRRFGMGTRGSTPSVRVRRGDVNTDITVTRGDPHSTPSSLPSIKHFDDGVYYVDLSRASASELDSIIADLARAPGIVFDMRGYPNSNHKILSHLLRHADQSRAWMAIPHVIRPDHSAISMQGWTTSGWELPVLQPHIGGRVAFLTGPGAISYAESIMSLVEYYHLGAIVGSTTAGTNGNVADIETPSGCITSFTGMRVTQHDGSRYHLVGVKPTIPVARSIAGVAAGRDEPLERALDNVREPSK